MSQRVLVLGANGFIGRRVVAQLSRSKEVAVIAAGRQVKPASMANGIDWHSVDATDEHALRRALGGVTGVVNCIAGSPETIIGSARALFAAAGRVNPAPRVVHLSSLAAYGSVSGTVDEDVTPRGDLGPYSSAKLTTEKLAGECASVVILRPGIVYGPRSVWWSDRIARLLCAGRLGDLGEAGEGLCNLVYVDDVAAAAVRALDVPNIDGRMFNLGAASVPTWNEYFARYAQPLGALPVRPITRNRLAMELYAIGPLLKLSELAARLRLAGRTDSPPPIRPWLLTLCRHRIQMVATRAETTLGMQWTPIDEGLKATADWYLAGGRT
jgi:2-alkyl-3-oxoalkanoate reductase